MSESLKLAGGDARTYFGSWTDRVTSIITFATALVTSVGSAYVVASSLGEPLIRWGLAVIVLCLCLGGLAFGNSSEESSLLDQGGKKMRRSSKSKPTGFAIVALSAACFLTTDLTLNLSGYFSPLEFGTPTISGSASTLVFRKDDGIRLQALSLRAAGFSKGPQGGSPCEISFEFRKRDRVKELLIRGVTLIVLEYSEAPTPLPIRASAVLARMPETVASFMLHKKNGPLPWKFKPVKMADDKGEQRQFKSFAVTDGFTNRMVIEVGSSDPGIYELAVELDLASDFRDAGSVSILKVPAGLLFVDYRPGDKKPNAGEEVVFMDWEGRFTTHPYGPDEPNFPRENLGNGVPSAVVPEVFSPPIPPPAPPTDP